MKLLKYSNTKEIEIKIEPDLYIDFVKKSIQGRLRIIDSKSEIQNNILLFKRVVRNTTHYGENQREAWKILREGLIRIEKIGSNRIRIYWEVKLDILIFLSILIGLLLGLIGFVSSIGIFWNIIIGFTIIIITYIVGFLIVKTEIDGIIETSI